MKLFLKNESKQLEMIHGCKKNCFIITCVKNLFRSSRNIMYIKIDYSFIILNKNYFLLLAVYCDSNLITLIDE